MTRVRSIAACVTIGLTATLAAAPLAAQSREVVEEFRTLARTGPDSTLELRAAERSWDALSALLWFFGDAAQATDDSTRDTALGAASRLARAYALARGDSFYVREVARVRAMSPADRLVNRSADSLRVWGVRATRTSPIDTAVRAWRESLALFASVGDSGGMAECLRLIGAAFISGYREAPDSAEAYFTQAFELAERIGDLIAAGNAMGNLAVLSSDRDELELARERFARARPFRERVGDRVGLAIDQANLGAVAGRMGDRAAARRAYEEAVGGLRGAGWPPDYAEALHNLGHAETEDGDYAQAGAHYEEALAIAREYADTVFQADVLESQGILAMARGDHSQAGAVLSAAAGLLRRTGPGKTISEGDVRMRLAQARAATGDLQGARAELVQAESLATRYERASDRVGLSLARVALARGDLALTFNRILEAEQQYARATRLARRGGRLDRLNAEVRQWAQYGSAVVLFRRERYQVVEVPLRALLGDSIDPPLAAEVHVLAGQAAQRRGDTASARDAFRRALDTLRALGDVAGEARALARLGDFERETGRTAVAESLYQRALGRLGARRAPGIAWTLHAGLAAVHQGRGALEPAAGALQAGIADIERMSGGLRLEAHRSAFLADKWRLYVDLALVERARGRTEAAFEVSERLRARQMLELLMRGRVGEGAAGTRLAAREQDLRRKVADLARQLEDSTLDDRGLRDVTARTAEADATSEALARAQEEYSEFLVEMREANPAYAALVAAEVAPARAVMAALAPDEALLEYLVGDSTTVVFVVTRDSLVAFDLGVGRDALVAQVDFARGVLAAPVAGATPPAWRPSLRRLYRWLITPVEAGALLASKRRLIIAPHAELHYLPFAALVRPGPPEQLLVERYVLEYVSSASVWLRLRERAQPARTGGVLALAPRIGALPGSRAEVAAIQRTHGDRTQALIGAQATEAAFRTQAPESEIIHLATFGVLNKHNPLFSYVQLNRGGEEDGRLEVHEVFGLSLKARLVVLSACQTAVGAGALADVPPGDDWIGLVQGFLYAGAGNVLGTLWPVSDLPTALLMEQFYQVLATGGSEAEALARVQRAAQRRSATAHPFFWAGFTLVRGR